MRQLHSPTCLHGVHRHVFTSYLFMILLTPVHHRQPASHAGRRSCHGNKANWTLLPHNYTAETRFATAVLTTFHLPQLQYLAVCLLLQRHTVYCVWLTHSSEECDSLQANHRRAYSHFRRVWPFVLRPVLRCPLYLHLERQKAELWGGRHFGRFAAATRDGHNSLPWPGWFFPASWSRRLNRNCRNVWPWASKASKSSLTAEWGTRLPQIFNSLHTYWFFKIVRKRENLHPQFGQWVAGHTK